MEKASLRQQLEAFANGSYMDSDGLIDTGCYNFYDWFCTKASLERRARILFGKLKIFLKHNPQVDLDTHYVFFKNNAPLSGGTYDSFSICDRETGKVIYWVTAKHSLSRNAELWTWDYSKYFKEPRFIQRSAKSYKALFATA